MDAHPAAGGGRITQDKITTIRAAVNELTKASRYVEGACPTGAAVIITSRDKILHLLDEAEKDTTTWQDNGYDDETGKEYLIAKEREQG